MAASRQTSEAIEQLVERAYDALSTPGADFRELFGWVDIGIAGSGLGELWSGADAGIAAGTAVALRGHRWTPTHVTVWERGDVAWAQILGSVRVVRDGVEEDVPYTTTGVFGREDDQWRWLYWGGSEPQESPRV